MTLAEAKEIYKKTGSHFFDKETMKFFGSRIESGLYKNRCFITSEKNFDGTARFYTVRRFNEDYTNIETIGEFNRIKTIYGAREVVKEIPVD